MQYMTGPSFCTQPSHNISTDPKVLWREIRKDLIWFDLIWFEEEEDDDEEEEDEDDMCIEWINWSDVVWWVNVING